MNRPSPPAPRRTWPLRDRPGLVWLGLAAALTLVHRCVPGSGWLLVHLVLLGALTHSAMVWSTHFTQALLKTPAEIDDRTQQNRRIALLIAGVAAVLVGVPTGVVAAHRRRARRPCRARWCGTASSCGGGCGARCPGRFRVTVRYYLAAAACVPVGATLGAWLARGLDDERHGAVLVAHSMVMVLGWIGLTVTGTLVTLWPTMLRTRMDDRAERLARQALPVLLTGARSARRRGGPGLSTRGPGRAGRVRRRAGSGGGARSSAPARQAPPKVFATWSVTAALGWWVVAIALVGWRLATSAVVGRAGRRLRGRGRGRGGRLRRAAALRRAVPPHPVGARGRPVRGASGVGVARPGALWRVTVVNLGLLVCLLPVTERRARGGVGARAGRARRVPPPAAALDRGRRRRPARPAGVGGGRQTSTGVRPTPPTPAEAPRARSGAPAAHGRREPRPRRHPRRRRRPGRSRAGTAASTPSGPSTAGVSAARAGVSPPATRRGCASRPTTCPTSPDSLSVPYGDRLVIDLVNLDDGSPHDLTFGNGIQTGRVMPGRSATLDVGVVGASTQGWCRIIGHRQMGMVLDVVVTGAPGESTAAARRPQRRRPRHRGSDAPVDLSGTPEAGFAAVPAALPPLDGARTHAVTLTIEEVELEVAPGVRQKRWTFNGAVPGPTLHGRVGDTFVVTLVNHGSMGHSVDFHAGERGARRGDAHHRPRRLAHLPVHRRPGRGVDVPLLDDADERAHRGRHARGRRHRAGRPAGGRPQLRARAVGGAPRRRRALVGARGGRRLGGRGHPGCRGVQRYREPVRRTAAGGAGRRPGALLGARRRAEPRARASTSSAPSSTRCGPEGAYLLRDGRRADGRTPTAGARCSTSRPPRAGSSSSRRARPGHYPFVTHAMADAERGARGILRVTP